MSAHRAYINCMRCYELEVHISQEEDKLIQLRLKDSQHQARDEAMKAIDCYISSIRVPYLDACMTCDFSKPYIATLLKANDKEIIKALATPEPQEKTCDYRTNAK